MPPMGGVTGAMRGTNRRGIGAKAARPKNMKHTVMRLFSYMKKDVSIEASTTNVEIFDTAIAIMAGCCGRHSKYACRFLYVKTDY